jgi:NDP-sugar pyrophosphorylase family protein
MKAMVLAAGKGERLKPITLTTPKPLLKVGGIPIIHRTLRLLKRDGFSEVVINLHHLGDKIRRSVGDGSAFGLKVSYSEEKETLGTGGGIRAAKGLLGAGAFLVINADILIDINLREVVKFHKEHRGAATLVVRDDPKREGYGAIRVDASLKVRDILGLVNPDPHHKPRLFTGVQILEPVFFLYCARGAFSSSTQDVFPKMMLDGLHFFAFEHKGYYRDIGTPFGFAQARLEFKNRNHPAFLRLS